MFYNFNLFPILSICHVVLDTSNDSSKYVYVPFLKKDFVTVMIFMEKMEKVYRVINAINKNMQTKGDYKLKPENNRNWYPNAKPCFFI